MSRYIMVKAYISTTFKEGSRPTPQKVRNWIRSGHVVGRVLGSTYYVDIMAEDLRSTGNKLADSVLAKVRRD